MKILVVGDWHSELHEEAVFHAFSSLGHEVFRFSWHQYFTASGPGHPSHSQFSQRLQNKFIVGPIVARINKNFVRSAINTRPDVVFVYRGTHITGDSLRKIKRILPATVLVGYNNDDPFAEGHSKLLWRHFLSAVPLYDLMLAYRHHNLADFTRIGARRVELLRSWFVPERNRPVVLTPKEQTRFCCDVVFAGHYEPDGRVALIERIVKEGFKLKLFGPEWSRVLDRSPILKQLAPIVPLHGEDYNKALCGAKIALCLLSKLNRDTYTRRCFEIPAAGTFMLAEHSNDLASIYREGVDAEFYRNEDELIAKLHKYLGDDTSRFSVAKAGNLSVHNDGHDIATRLKQVLSWVKEI